MSTRRSGADGPEDIDAAFAEIVAGLEADVPKWPDQSEQTGETGTSSAPERHTAADPPTPEASVSRGPPEGDPRTDYAGPADPDDEHFVPPEPPPVPAPKPQAVGAMALIGLGILLLTVPQLVGIATTASLPVGLIAISAGIGWLVLRKRHNPPSDSDPDDGAQV